MADEPNPTAAYKPTIGPTKDFTVRWTVLLSVAGIIIMGVLSMFRRPEFEAGTATVLATLTGIVSGVVTGKFSLANPRNGGETGKVHE